MTRASSLVIALFLHFGCSSDVRDERGWRAGRQRLHGIELRAGASTLAWNATTATLYVADRVMAYDATHQRFFVIERDRLHVLALSF